MTTASCIAYKHVPHTSALLLDYLYHYDRVSQFYSGSPYIPASFQRVADQVRGFKGNRRQIVDILARQNRDFGCGEPTLANLQRLSEPGTFAVVTGQQVGLFGGPAFTLYKALTAIRLAQSLSAQDLPSVPVFWMATEDHDLAEVAGASAFNEDYDLMPLRDSGDRPSPQSPVGQVWHTAEVAKALEELETLLPAGEPRSQLLADLRDCYVPGTTWGRSFAKFMTRLLGRWGVILLDPLDESIRQLLTGIYARVLDDATGLRERVTDRSYALLRHGYHAQVHVAEDSTLLFVTHQGDRVPLQERDGKLFLDGNGEVSIGKLRSWVADRPQDFSPNVLLRPLAQDTLLPTLAYVAGPAEIAYLAQAQVLYQAFGHPQPVIFPRAAFTLLDSRTDRLMEKYKLTLEDVWQGEGHLSQRIAATGFAEGWSEHLDQSERDLDQLLSRLHNDIEKLDPTLLDSLQHTQEKMKFQLERLRGKVTRAALGRSELLARHEQALRRFLMPHTDLQERRVSGVYFLGRAGYDLLDRLFAQVQTHCSDHQTLKY